MKPVGKAPCLIWGASGHAKVLMECVDVGAKVEAFVDRNTAVKSLIEGVPIFHNNTDLEQWIRKYSKKAQLWYLIAIGGEKGNTRLKIHNYLLRLGLTPMTAVHATAFVAKSAVLGAGSQVLAQATVCVEARIGVSCIINTAASVDHECVLEDGAHIAPGATLAGCVHVGKCAMIGAGATLLPRLKIGSFSIVGAGAVVVKDVPPYTVVVGNPARNLRAVTCDPSKE